MDPTEAVVNKADILLKDEKEDKLPKISESLGIMEKKLESITSGADQRVISSGSRDQVEENSKSREESSGVRSEEEAKIHITEKSKDIKVDEGKLEITEKRTEVKSSVEENSTILELMEKVRILEQDDDYNKSGIQNLQEKVIKLESKVTEIMYLVTHKETEKKVPLKIEINPTISASETSNESRIPFSWDTLNKTTRSRILRTNFPSLTQSLIMNLLNQDRKEVVSFLKSLN